MNTDTIAPEDGLESYTLRRQFAREKLANPATTKAERVDLLAEIEWWESRIALASVGRRA